MAELTKILQFEKTHKIKTNVYRIFPWIRQYLETAGTRDGKWFFNKVLHKFYCRELYAIIDISYEGGIQPCGLVPAFVSIKDNRGPGLMKLWQEATVKIKNDLDAGNYYYCCNGCCHHFSRNMLASLFKYPVKNRETLIRMMPLIISRVCSGMRKKFYFYG